MAEETPAKRAQNLRTKIAEAELDRMKNSGNGMFAVMPSKRAKAAEDAAVHNKLQNLREEEAEALEQRAKGMKKGGVARGWGKARGARQAKTY